MTVDFASDGQIRIFWVLTIASIAAPTVAELNAGTDLTPVMTADGLVGFEANTADVDTSSINSTFDTKTIGRDSFSGTLVRLKKQTGGTDSIYNTMNSRGTSGYVAIRRDIAYATAWTAAQKCEIYPAILGPIRRLAPIANNVTKYEVDTKISSAPNLNATVS
jgi:hypothetical protein